MRVFLVVLLCLALVFMPACVELEEDNDNTQEIDKQLREQIRQDISVDIDFQDFDAKGRQKLVVWVENHGQYTFSGDAHLKVEGESGQYRGSEIIIVEDLSPRDKIYVIMWLRANTGLHGSAGYRWSNYTLE